MSFQHLSRFAAFLRTRFRALISKSEGRFANQSENDFRLITYTMLDTICPQSMAGDTYLHEYLGKFFCHDRPEQKGEDVL